MKLRDDLVDRPPELGARLVALRLLTDAEDAARRLAGDDAEALHDFRVALRRLRSALRTFRPVLASGVRRKLMRRVRKLARSTSAARDAQVQLAWLASRAAELGAERLRPGHEALVARFERCQAVGARERDRLRRRFQRLARKLAPGLGSYEARVPLDGQQAPFSAVLAALATEGFGDLRTRLQAVRAADDAEPVHRARIQGKHLRYLLETLEGNAHADSGQALSELEALQDLLGDLHDTHVLAAEVAEALVDAAGERARHLYAAAYGGAHDDQDDDEQEVRGPATQDGLLEIARLARARRDALFAELARWRGDRLAALEAAVQRIARALEDRAGGHVERERKFLLSALPPAAQRGPSAEIVQGWLPGELLRERVRRVAGSDGGARFFRAIKHGTGEHRLEAEEEISSELFDALWQLTEGRRVSKRRWKLTEGELTWELDQFQDRDLVLAEVELPAAAEAPELPEWLAPYVLREVTGEPAYANFNLARATATAPPPTPSPGHAAAGAPA